MLLLFGPNCTRPSHDALSLALMSLAEQEPTHCAEGAAARPAWTHVATCASVPFRSVLGGGRRLAEQKESDWLRTLDYMLL
jgi:hypothetical protein